MALVDFYQLATLHKLSRADPEFPSAHSRFLSMPDTPPPPSPSPSAEPDEVHPSLPLSIQSQPKTPKRNRNAVHPVPKVTPLSRGSSIRQRQEGDTDRVEGYDRDDYEEYVHEDLKSRVFVDFEVFMKSVLHVPEDWNTQWKSVIEAVIADPEFKQHYEEYCKYCDDSTTREALFYEPLTKMANAVLDVWSQSGRCGTNPGIPQTYHVSNTRKLQGGIFNKASLSPDLVVLHKDCDHTLSNLHWANALHVLEVKSYGTAICGGRGMPKLVVDGINPTDTHAPATILSRRKNSTPLTTSTTTLSGSNHGSSRKRPADGSSTINPQPGKKSRTNMGKTEEGQSRSTPNPETQRQLQPARQVCRYLIEMFSVPLLRSHATVSLVDRDRLQLYHANHSVILVSSAINFSASNGLEKLIATIIAFRRLSPEQNGILETLFRENTALTTLVQNSNIAADDKVVQKGNMLVFTGNEPDKNFKVELGETISRDPAAVGRSTAVVEGTSGKWSETELVIKVSWPGSGRVPETHFLEEACKEAKKTENKWAVNHLPQMLHARDVAFEPESTLGKVALLFQAAELVDGEFEYECRTLRVIIQEQLYSLKLLKNVKDIGQVFVDIACIHRWLFDKPGILHRDLSFNNIMFRIIKTQRNAEGETEYKVYGVLTDYDLSSWVASLKNNYAKTSQQRTGTPPYMAQELLRGTNDIHLYRHDIESLFYIMLLTCARHKLDQSDEAKWSVVMREGPLPYQDWFDERNYDKLGSLKGTFFTETPAIELSPTFEDIRQWLVHLQYRFSDGFEHKFSYKKRKERVGDSAGELPPFDDETLGGYINYSSLIEPICRLTGELKGLTIRYSPPSSQADA